MSKPSIAREALAASSNAPALPIDADPNHLADAIWATAREAQWSARQWQLAAQVLARYTDEAARRARTLCNVMVYRLGGAQ